VREFDAGIISHELSRMGLDWLRAAWTDVALNGFCTMSPEVGRWVNDGVGVEVASPTANHLLSLGKIAGYLLPKHDALHAQRHRAGADAHLALLVYIALLERAKTATDPQVGND
jgi:hypothetical protein